MMIATRLENRFVPVGREILRAIRMFTGFANLLLAVCVICAAPAYGLADDDDDDSGRDGRHCSETADALYRGCRNEVQHDYWIGVAKCTNVSDAEERDQREKQGRKQEEETGSGLNIKQKNFQFPQTR